MQSFMRKDEAYQKVLRDVWVSWDYKISPRGRETRERLFYSFRVTRPERGPVKVGLKERDEAMAIYFAKELELFMSKTDKAYDWAKASKFWMGIANPDLTVNSNYWKRLTDWTSPGNWENRVDGDYWRLSQWDWAKLQLIKDMDTRQAFCHLNMPKDQWFKNLDQPCTMFIQFLLREGLLHMGVVMRSNDVVKGLSYDMPFFIELQYKMLEELQLKYSGLLGIGSYNHTAQSMHAYESDAELIEQMLDCCGGREARDY